MSNRTSYRRAARQQRNLEVRSNVHEVSQLSELTERLISRDDAAELVRAIPSCDLCSCLVLHQDRADVGSWYVVCEHCIADEDDRKAARR